MRAPDDSTVSFKPGRRLGREAIQVAALAIVFAGLTVSRAAAQIVFGAASFASAVTNEDAGGGVASDVTSLFSFAVPGAGGNTGVRFGGSTVFVSWFSAPTGAENIRSAVLDLYGNGCSGPLPVGTIVPFSYSFTATPDAGVTIGYWEINLRLQGAGGTQYFQIVGSGGGLISGSANVVIDVQFGIANLSEYEVTMGINYTSATDPSAAFTLTMESAAGQGFTLGAAPIPEPATSALLMGGLALAAIRLRAARRHQRV
jgi:hypothetical protein